jgi:nucleotide-binding universal stress UspA family protein
MISLDTVLVAFDFGETSQKALSYGRNLTRAFGGRLHVLHVADVIATSASQFYPDHPGDPELRAELLALKQLRALLPQGSAELAVRIAGSPGGAIVKHAESIGADVIVVGTHGRDGVSRLLMGSVAEYVVRHAPCPVLVVRRNEHEFVLPDPVSVATRI